MSFKEVPLSELLMQDPDLLLDLTSPLNSVDASSKDMIIVQEELEKRLKQRVGRQDLVERNILPPLSFPTAPKLFTNTKELHRAQIADNLQKRMRNRPARDNLMQMNILPDLQLNIDPALQATQLQLRKSKLADALNDKLANRPGPLQLLQNGIIEPHLSEVVKGYELDPATTATTTTTMQPPLLGNGVSPETEKSETIAFSSIPEISLYSGEVGFSGIAAHRHPFQQRHSIAGLSPSVDVLGMDTSPGPIIEAARVALTGGGGDVRKFSDSSISPVPSPLGGNYGEAISPEKSPRGFNATYPPIFRTSLSTGVLAEKAACSPSVARKKQQKKYRKLRYHEYVPPSKSTPKGGKTNPKPPSKSDSPYSSLLQQQQLFLQLQVLQQQYPNGVLMQKLPDMINSLSKEQKALAIAAVKGRVSVTSPTDLAALNKQTTIPQILPVEHPNKHNTSSVRFEDLKVNDLKTACKELGMIVSGKKAELVERLIDQNKGILPALALPENLAKESRRMAFSQGQCSSVDSHFSSSSVLSPGSPNDTSPVFKFPSEQQRGSSAQDGGGSASFKQSGRVQLSEVFPTANLHKEFNELIERQKRNYIISQKGSEKSIAPRPELSELLAMKLLPSYPTSTASFLDQRAKGGALPGNNNGRPTDPRSQVMTSEKSSRSLPASPKANSPANTPGYEILDSNTEMSARIPHMKSFSNVTSPSDAGTCHEHGLGSTPASGDAALAQSTAVGGGACNVSMQSVSAGGSTLTTSYYQQQLLASSMAGKQPTGVRPGRSSMPAQPAAAGGHQGAHAMGPPSYISVMRSRSITGAHPNPSLVGMEVMHSGPNSFVPGDLAGLATPPNEMSGKSMNPDLFVSDSGDMAMDTGESSISDIFDILRAEGEGFNQASQPASLPVLSGNHAHQPRRPPSSLPQTPHYAVIGSSGSGGGGGGSKSNLIQDSPHYMLGNIMPFGNPSLTSQNKSGSDMGLNLVGMVREGQKNSTGLYANNNNSIILGNELNWLDLDNTSGLGLSPTLQGHSFGNLNSHSNPGSLPHDQFQSSFLEDGMGQHGMLEKAANPGGMNGYPSGAGGGGGGGGEGMFLDSGGVLHQSGLYSTEEEQQLLELGLSTTS